MNDEEIREIQTALRALSFTDARIPRLIVNGLFDKETKRAVVIFQRLYDLPQTGAVDPETWDRLREAYLESQHRQPRPLSVFPHEEFVLRVGDSHESVPVVRHILNTLSARYDNLPNVGNGDTVYDRRIADAVLVLRRLHDLEETDETDILVWNLLAALYEESSTAVGSGAS